MFSVYTGSRFFNTPWRICGIFEVPQNRTFAKRKKEKEMVPQENRKIITLTCSF